MNKAKQTKTQRAKFAFADAVYRWEFLKRCVKYQRDYDDFVKKYGEEGVRVRFEPTWIVAEYARLGEDPRVPSKGCFMNRLMNDIYAFRASWGIDPTNPKFGYPPFIGERVSWISEVVSGDHVDAKHPDELILSINVNGPELEILDYLRWRIRLAKQSRGLSVEKEQRKRFDVYNSYLRAFDLKEAGKAYDEIAQDTSLLELAAKNNVQMTAKRALAYVNRARMLILKAQRGDW